MYIITNIWFLGGKIVIIKQMADVSHEDSSFADPWVTCKNMQTWINRLLLSVQGSHRTIKIEINDFSWT